MTPIFSQSEYLQHLIDNSRGFLEHQCIIYSVSTIVTLKENISTLREKIVSLLYTFERSFKLRNI